MLFFDSRKTNRHHLLQSQPLCLTSWNLRLPMSFFCWSKPFGGNGMGSLGQWQPPAHLSLSDPCLLLHQICLSFPGILTASCSQRDITNTCHIFVSSSGPTGALRYLVGFASHRKDLDFRDTCLGDKLVYNFLSLPICPHCLLSLVAAWNL